MKKYLLIAFLLLSFAGESQIITTIAGNGVRGHTGDGGAATAAAISTYGLCLDSHGNLYFTQDGGGSGCWVRKITPCGIITGVAGGAVGCGDNGDGIPATSAKLANPTGIAFDANDNMYIADWSNQRVRKVDAVTGLIT